PADEAGRPKRVGGASVARAIAALRHVAGVDGGTADGGALGVRGTRGARPGAVFCHVTDAGGGPALRGGRREGVGGAEGACAGAVLAQIAHARRAAADDRVRLEGIGRTGG